MSSIRDGLVAFWPLDINSKDKLGRNNGTDTSITYDGTQAKLNGSSSYIQAPSPVINSGTKITVSVMMYSNSSSQPQDTTVFGNQAEGSLFGIIFARNTSVSNKWGMFWGDGAGHWNTFNANYFDISANIWHHIVCEIDGNHGKVFLDGVQVIDYTTSYNVNFTSASNFTFGREATLGSTGREFDGNLKMGSVYNRTLSPQEVLKLYQQGGNPFYKPNIFKRISNFISGSSSSSKPSLFPFFNNYI